MRADQWLVLLSGLAAIAWVLWYFFSARKSRATAAHHSGVQEITIRVQGGYDPSEIEVRSGRPVRLLFDRQEDNPCSDELVIPDFKIHRSLAPHATTTVELTPTAAGVHEFRCGMGMLHGRLIVT
jgi:plastocyanin domain-containing protein